MKALLLLAVLAAVPNQAHALTPLQVWAAHRAYSDGGRWGSTLRAILGQESSWCERIHGNDPDDYGCGQLELNTARMFDPTATEADLEFDRIRNIQDAAMYLDWCMDQAHDWRGGVACYKYGWPVASQLTQPELMSDGYVRAIVQRMKEWQ